MDKICCATPGLFAGEEPMNQAILTQLLCGTFIHLMGCCTGPGLYQYICLHHLTSLPKHFKRVLLRGKFLGIDPAEYQANEWPQHYKNKTYLLKHCSLKWCIAVCKHIISPQKLKILKKHSKQMWFIFPFSGIVDGQNCGCMPVKKCWPVS